MSTPFRNLDTVRAYKERNKLGRFGEEAQARQNGMDLRRDDIEEKLRNQFPVNARCKVSSLTQESATRGVIRFVGPVEFNKTHRVWIGVELDEPVSLEDKVVWRRLPQSSKLHRCDLH